MLNKNYIEQITMMYIHSYNTAFQEVKNPEFAVQIATNVIIAVSITGQQKQFGSFETLFAQLVAQMQEGSEERHDIENNEAD